MTVMYSRWVHCSTLPSAAQTSLRPVKALSWCVQQVQSARLYHKKPCAGGDAHLPCLLLQVITLAESLVQILLLLVPLHERLCTVTRGQKSPPSPGKAP